MVVSVSFLPASDVPGIWGMPPADRTRKQLGKAGILSGGDTGFQSELILRGDVVYDDAVLVGLTKKINVLLVHDDGRKLAGHATADRSAEVKNWLEHEAALPPPGIDVLTPSAAGFAYNRQLRKKANPQCHIATHGTAREIEWQLFKASYKGVTDIVTKYVWPVPAFHATRLCARLGLSPNVVTGAGAVLMLAALVLFWHGLYGYGLLAGWIMTFLDTVDGKLARCTLTSSKWGNIFDHGIDLIHPPFWYIAWGIGLAAWGLTPSWLAGGLIAMFACYVLGRLCEGYFIRRFGFHIHVWRRVDSIFRTIVARRNPNMILLTISWLFGRPDLGLAFVILWTIAAVPIHLFQIAQAETARRNGRTLSSWLSV